MMTFDNPADKNRRSRQLLRRLTTAFLLVLGIIATGLTGYAQAKSAIKIATNDSVRSQVNAQLLVQVLREAGFKADLAVLSAKDIPAALASGAVQILPEVSVEKVQTVFKAPLADGSVIDLGYKQAGADDPKYRKLAWSKTRRRWTSEFKLIKNMTIPEQDVLAMVAAIQNNGEDASDVVAKWVTNNKPRWGKWKSASKNWMKP